MEKALLIAFVFAALIGCSSAPKTQEENKEAASVEATQEEAKTESAAEIEDIAAVEGTDTAEEDSVEFEAVEDIAASETTETEFLAAGEESFVSEVTTTTITESSGTTEITEEVEFPEILGTPYADFEEGHSVQATYEASTQTSNEQQVTTIVRAASGQPTVVEDLTVSEAFESGLYEVSQRCHLRESPSKAADILGYVSAGKVIWADDMSVYWAQVYRKSGPAYIHKGCF